MRLRTLFRGFVADIYDPSVIEKLFKDKSMEIDSRALYNFSMKELKKRVTSDVWSKLTAGDPLFKIAELEDICDISDVIPHFHHTLPPHLTRAAALLDQRQREAKRVTLEYMKTEKALIEQRQKEINDFPILTTDSYEVHTGLMIVRDPIWLLCPQHDIDWFRIKYKTMVEHGKVANIDPKDFEYIPETPDFESERLVRLKQITKKLDDGEDLVYTPLPNTVHYLEADPNEPDPRSIGYAGGYCVWLLFKEKNSNNWVFPTYKMFGKQTFTECRRKILKEMLRTQLKTHILGPQAVKVDVVDYKDPITVTRPKYIEEDVYDLYMKRIKILFPNASDSDLVKYLIKKYDMVKNPEPMVKEIKGKKVYYFRCIYKNGTIDLKDNKYYSDWAWVPKPELNRYLNEENYNKFIKTMTKT